MIEPFFDCYYPMVKIAGGNVVFVPLRPTVSLLHTPCFVPASFLSLWFCVSVQNTGSSKYPSSSKDFALDPEELARAFSPKTKMIILNTPNNPIGKVDYCGYAPSACYDFSTWQW